MINAQAGNHWLRREWIFTFGFGHTHPHIPDLALGNHFVRIRAYTEEEARAIMVARYGQTWAFQYGRDEIDTRDLTELVEDVPTAKPGSVYVTHNEAADAPRELLADTDCGPFRLVVEDAGVWDDLAWTIMEEAREWQEERELARREDELGGRDEDQADPLRAER